jgi:hypothetical protein
LAKMPDTVDNSMDRADERVAAQAKANNFSTDGVFLVGEGQGDEGGAIKVRLSRRLGKDATVADVNGDVLESKRGAVSGRSSVLTRSAEEKESNAEHVDNRESFGGAMLPGKVGGMVHNGNRNRFDPIRRRVGPGVSAELATEAKFGFARRSQPRVRGPHARKGLTHGT